MGTMPTITWVSPEASSTGKTVKVLLTAPEFQQGVTHFAYIPAGLAPQKWNRIDAQTIKFGDVEVDYLDEQNVRVALKAPRRQVSFFGTVALVDGEALAETTWADKRTTKVDDTQSF